MHRPYLSSDGDYQYGLQVSVVVGTASWASEASPTLGCSIEISRDIVS